MYTQFKRKRILSQRGQSMTEFIIIVPVAFTLIFGCLQFALIYQAKITLNYAAYSAARIASVNHATFASARRGFTIGMAPFFAYDDDSMVVAKSLQVADDLVTNGYVKLVRINPTAAAFSAFGQERKQDEDDDNSDDIVVIPNDNLMYRNAGVAANVNIQDANLLKIGVVYCYHLSFPFIREAIRDAVASYWATTSDVLTFDCVGSTNDEFTIPIRASAIVRMQTDAFDDPTWPDPLATIARPGPSDQGLFNFGNIKPDASYSPPEEDHENGDESGP